MSFALPDEVLAIFAKMEEANYEVYLVGGAVRDILMGKALYDWDFATNAKPEEIQALFPDSFYNNKFGTVGIPAQNPEFKPHEITTYRQDVGYSDSRRPDEVLWGTSLTEDLSRRDFTINAIALKGDGEIVDPHHGQEDIKKKLIRAVGDPSERFSEDALRMMRAVRFAAQLGFEIEFDTFEAIKMHAATIHKISKERVRGELMKTLAAPFPYEGMTIFRSSGLMDEVLPELAKTFGVEQKSPERHHEHGVGTHLMQSLKNCPSPDPLVRFATLLHDIGKPLTYKVRDGIITFYNHEVVGSRIVVDIAKRLRFSRHEQERLFKLVRWHQFTVDERQTDKAIRRLIRNVGVENIDDMLALRTGDRLGGGASETSWRLEEFKERLVEVQKQPFSVRDLQITGSDVMEILEIPPSKRVGEILSAIFEEVVEKKLPNERDALVARVKELVL